MKLGFTVVDFREVPTAPAGQTDLPASGGETRHRLEDHAGTAGTHIDEKSALRPACGRPEGRFRYVLGSNLANIRPGRPIYGPETLLESGLKSIANKNNGRSSV